ncbi:MAG: hypothetical protein AUJ92_20020 [Armatimonadetes bacterium CG2_30_59_28]|nr:HlyC/CorC family transporter [Armatimonadota bacterium]OIO89902.1 MAG: hypothetical protein AUJ92_20020 [Armatimonadetes bacterium CG2_30_59_28]
MPSDPDSNLQTDVLTIIAILLALTAVLAATQIGLLTMGRARARELDDDGSRAGRLALRLLNDRARTLVTVLLCITSLLFTAEALATCATLHWRWGIVFPLIVVPLVVVLFATVVPILYASQEPEKVSLQTAPLLYAIWIILAPVTACIDWTARRLVRSVGGGPHVDESTMTEDEIKTAIDEAEEVGLIEAQEREMLHGALEFSEKTVREVMVPRSEIVGVPATATLQEVMQIIAQEKHSRIPVYRATLDDICGVIYAKDILKHIRLRQMSLAAEQVARPPFSIPEMKRVDALFEELQQKHRLMAIVVGVDGGTAGLVTVEDLLEEIVGDILDEHDEAEQEWEQIDENTWLVDAGMCLRKVNRLLGIHLPGNGYQTLAGLILEHTGHLPSAGQEIAVGNARVVVDETDGQRIARARLVRTVEYHSDPDERESGK